MQRGIVLVGAILVALIGLRTVPDTVAEEKEKSHLTFEIYKDAKSEFRWRLKAGNGQIIATSGEGYKAKADAEHGIKLIQDGAAKAKVEETK